jgi:hypothetical protein
MIETVQVGPLTLPVVALSDDDSVGEYRPRPTPCIAISGDLTGRVRAMAVLHEALHAIADLYGLPLDERDVQTLELTLTALIRDNPALVDALVA